MPKFFSHARTALKYGLKKLHVKSGQRVLVPNYICSVILQPLLELGINPVYYDVNDRFDPDWKRLAAISDNIKCHAIFMVHYFGQPQNVNKFKEFCSKNNLLLIEDNAHGFGGMYNGKLLGSFGDIGVSSPRKILNTKYGGLLYLSGVVQDPPTSLKPEMLGFVYSYFKRLIFNNPRVCNYLFIAFNRQPDITDPSLFHEPFIEDRLSDYYSTKLIERYSDKEIIANEISKRKAAWEDINEMVISLGGRAVFHELCENSVPWAYPFYTNGLDHRLSMYNSLTDNGYLVFPWPALPDDVITSDCNTNSVERWHRLLCVLL